MTTVTFEDAEVRKAHLRLHGQTLLDEWNVCVAAWRRTSIVGRDADAVDAAWDDAVWREFGATCTVKWTFDLGTDSFCCALSVGERYEFSR